MEPPGASEKRLRFGCGFVMGLALGAGTALHLAISNGYYGAAIWLVCGLVCGVLAMHFGDRFWHSLSGFMNRWWW